MSDEPMEDREEHESRTMLYSLAVSWDKSKITTLTHEHMSGVFNAVMGETIARRSLGAEWWIGQFNLPDGELVTYNWGNAEYPD